MATEKTDVVIAGMGTAGGILAAEFGKVSRKESRRDGYESSPARFGVAVFAPNPVLGQSRNKVKSPVTDG